MAFYESPVFPLDAANLSIPQLMTQYNPDDAPADKVVHTDTLSDKALTYASLRDQAGRAAWGLRKLGLRPGDVLLAMVNNSNDFVLLAHATWWTGAVFAPLSIAATPEDISHILKIVRPTHIATIAPKLDSVRAALSSSSLTNTKVLTVLSKVENVLQFPNDIIGSSPGESIAPYDLEGKSAKDVPSTICFSSGTTGSMKGVLLSHYNIVMNSLIMRLSLPVRYNSSVREVFFAPYCHIYGLSIAVVAGMWVGAHYCGLPAFDLETFCQKSSELEVTDLHIVPPVALLLATSPVAQKYNFSSLKRIVISAAPLKAPLQHLLQKRLPHITVCQGYGLSEATGGVIHQVDQDDRAIGCVGKLFAGVQGRLVNPQTGKDSAVGEEGELWVRGPVVMMGYINNKEATEQTFSGDWLRTGDILKLDENQNFWVTDRLKEMIKYKGFQIPPSELEDLLLQHPDVADAAVCAVYDDAQATEVPLAYVILTPAKVNLPDHEKQQVLGAIQNWMDGQVAGYKKLRGGVFQLQTLPKTPTGKVLRRLLPAKLNEGRPAKL